MRMRMASAAVVAFISLVPGLALADSFTDPATMKDAIKGTMRIEFDTRTQLDKTGKRTEPAGVMFVSTADRSHGASWWRVNHSCQLRRTNAGPGFTIQESLGDVILTCLGAMERNNTGSEAILRAAPQTAPSYALFTTSSP